MGATALGWILAVLAGLGAALLLHRLRREMQQREAGEAQREELQAELETARSQVAERSGIEREHRAEVSKLRARIDQLKRRASRSRDEKGAQPGRIRELEERLEESRADLTASRGELEEAYAELARTRKLLDSALATPRPKPDPEAESHRRRIASLEERSSKAERLAQTLQEQLETASAQAARFQKRAETLDKVYVVLRGQHELKKEQLRAHEEELWRLRAIAAARTVPAGASEPDASGAADAAAAGSPEPSEASKADRSVEPAEN